MKIFFRGEYDNELSFFNGEIIYLNRKVNDEWLEGESQKSGLCGIFPIGFVEIVVDLMEQKLDFNTNNIQSIGYNLIYFILKIFIVLLRF